MVAGYDVRRWRVRLLAAALGVGIVGTLLATSSVGAAGAPRNDFSQSQQKPKKLVDTHAYPRTYNIYSGGPSEELSRYDMVVGLKSLDAAGLRLRNPTGIFLLQPSLQGGGSIHVTAPGGAVGWRGAMDTLAGGTALGQIRATNPDWDFLHNADGSLASIGKILGWNLAAPPDKGVPQEVARVFSYSAKLDGLYRCTVRIGKPGAKKRVPCWSGVHSDNWIYSSIGADWFYGGNLDTDRDGVVDSENTLKRNWANGLTQVGTLLRAYLPGMVVGGNGAWYRQDLYTGSDPKGWLKASNYTLIEGSEKYSAETLLSVEKNWLSFPDPLGRPRYIAVMQKATDINGKALVWTQGDVNTPAAMLRTDVLRSMRWGLTLSVMTGAYFELLGDWYGPGHAARWWFDEFDGGVDVRRRGYLGQPRGTYKQLAEGVYRRDFDKGIAINNSTSQAQLINLNGTFRKLKGTQNPSLNDGSTVTSVAIPPKDGIILLRTPAG